MLNNEYENMSFGFTYGEYENGGTYLGCETEEGPYADISVWTNITRELPKSEILIPLYKLDKAFLDKIESYGFLKVEYNRTRRIGYGEGCIGVLTPDYIIKINEINKEWLKKLESQ